MIMFTTIAIGILSSTVAEIVTALNKKLSNTVLKGDGAFLMATAIALVGSAVKVFYFDGVALPSFHDLAAWKAIVPAFTQVWTVSQMYFLLVTEKLHLDVQPMKDPVASV